MKIRYLVLILSFLFIIGCTRNLEQGHPVPDTSACAITSPPSDMEGINSHPEFYGTGADPDIITLGPKTGANPDWEPYSGKYSMEFELDSETPVLAPIDMELIGVYNRNAEYRLREGIKEIPYDDLELIFRSADSTWPNMIIVIYHLKKSPLVMKDNHIEEWETGKMRAEGELFFTYDNYKAPAWADSPEGMIGHVVKRGEVIGYAGSVVDHPMAPFGFKVSYTSENPTVKTGNKYLHWVQPSSFFYWKCYSPDTNFPQGVLAYPFECNGYQLPIEQRNVNFKFSKI